MKEDYRSAALRHLKDAEILAGSSRLDNAGQLIGYAAECAMKLAFTKHLKEDIDGHLPILCGVIRRRLEGRNVRCQLLGIVRRRPWIFDQWHINNRYGCDGHVSLEIYRIWLDQTNLVFQIAGVRAGE